MNRNDTQKAIESGKAVLGIEFGSTRIKTVLIGEDHRPIASGSFDLENRYENGIWSSYESAKKSGVKPPCGSGSCVGGCDLNFGEQAE